MEASRTSHGSTISLGQAHVRGCLRGGEHWARTLFALLGGITESHCRTHSLRGGGLALGWANPAVEVQMRNFLFLAPTTALISGGVNFVGAIGDVCRTFTCHCPRPRQQVFVCGPRRSGLACELLLVVTPAIRTGFP